MENIQYGTSLKGMSKLQIVEIQSGKYEVQRDEDNEPFFGVMDNERLTDIVQNLERRVTELERKLC